MGASPATELPPGPAKFNSVISNNYLQQVGEGPAGFFGIPGIRAPRDEGEAFHLQGGPASLNVARGPTRAIARRVQSPLEISVVSSNEFSRRSPSPPPPSSPSLPLSSKRGTYMCTKRTWKGKGGENGGNDDGLMMTDADFRSRRCARLKRERERENAKGEVYICGEREREMERETRRHGTVNKVINGDRAN